MKPLVRTFAFAVICMFAANVSASEVGSYTIIPGQIELTFKNQIQGIQVQQSLGAGLLGKTVSEKVEWASSDEKVFRVEGNHIVAVGNGSAKLTAKFEEKDKKHSLEVPVVVRDAERTMEWEFANHVQAIMARAGCNTGACHGALAGKGGFRLSLRGYDPKTDHFNITRQDRGRRIELSDPAQSLLIAKPSGAIAHKGGVRLPENSRNYAILADWIAKGATPTKESDPKLSRLEVLPSRSLLSVGDVQNLMVLAHYDNGRTEDVTAWAKYSSTDESVGQVDEHGHLKISGPGEGSVVVWFASRLVNARFTVPYGSKVESGDYEKALIANTIDHLVLDQLRQLEIAPSPRCSDSEFIRRAFLDTIGTLPTEEEARNFVADPSVDKRIKLIDQLLDRPEFVDYWTYRWSDVLMLNGNLLRPDAIKSYYAWIRGHVKKNTPWDQMVREILTAQGESLENGATNFYALNQDPESMTENACQAFMGLSIGCAKCHNHPLEKWTNDQYYAMANLFARVRGKGWGGDGRDGDGKRTLVVLERGDLIQPLTGKPQPPAPLDSPPIDPNATQDRRIYLADWMVSPENPYFTKSIVNRVWANFFGIGIVNAVDDMRASNPPSNPLLLAALEKQLINNHYDLKSLMRLILESETYQRSSMSIEENRSEAKYFSRYYPKRLMAEVIHDAVCQITEVPSKFNEIEYSGSDKKPTDFYPEGTRAIQLYDSAVGSSFLKTFGRNQRRITCECERSDEPSVVQVLNLNNGTTVNDKLAKTGNRVDRLLAACGEDSSALIDHAYWRCLSRAPTESEREEFLKEFQTAPAEERRVVAEDLFWSILSSREFLFNH